MFVFHHCMTHSSHFNTFQKHFKITVWFITFCMYLPCKLFAYLHLILISCPTQIVTLQLAVLSYDQFLLLSGVFVRRKQTQRAQKNMQILKYHTTHNSSLLGITFFGWASYFTRSGKGRGRRQTIKNTENIPLTLIED